MENQIVELFKERNPLNQLDLAANTLVVGARSPETAVAVSDYPYGRRLRCFMRYWLETRAGHGTRLVSQTNNPKKPGLVWNKPHAGTYSQCAVVLHTNEEAHVKARYLSNDAYNVKTVADCEAKLASVDNFERNYDAALIEFDRSRLTSARESLSRRLIELSTPHAKAPQGQSCDVCHNYASSCTGTNQISAAAPGGVCDSCGAFNQIVNQCGCDKQNLPTVLDNVANQRYHDEYADDPNHSCVVCAQPVSCACGKEFATRAEGELHIEHSPYCSGPLSDVAVAVTDETVKASGLRCPRCGSAETQHKGDLAAGDKLYCHTCKQVTWSFGVAVSQPSLDTADSMGGERQTEGLRA